MTDFEESIKREVEAAIAQAMEDFRKRVEEAFMPFKGLRTRRNREGISGSLEELVSTENTATQGVAAAQKSLVENYSVTLEVEKKSEEDAEDDPTHLIGREESRSVTAGKQDGSKILDGELDCGVVGVPRNFKSGGRLGDYGAGFTGGGRGSFAGESGGRVGSYSLGGDFGGGPGEIGGALDTIRGNKAGILGGDWLGSAFEKGAADGGCPGGMAGKGEHGCKTTTSGGLKRDRGGFVKGGSGACGSGGGPGCCFAEEKGDERCSNDGRSGVGGGEMAKKFESSPWVLARRGGDFCGGFTGGGVLVGIVPRSCVSGDGGDYEGLRLLSGLQKYPERKVKGRSFLESCFGLESKPIMEGTRRGRIVNIRRVEVAKFGDHSADHTDVRHFVARELGFLHLKPIGNPFNEVWQCFGPADMKPNSVSKKPNLFILLIYTHFSTLQPIALPIQTFANLTQAFVPKYLSFLLTVQNCHINAYIPYFTQNSTVFHDKLLCFPALRFDPFKIWTRDRCCQGRDSSADYKPP